MRIKIHGEAGRSVGLRRAGCAVVVACVAALSGVGGCAGTTAGQGTRASAAMKENAVKHNVSNADLDATHDRAPLQGTGVALWVNGLGCPQCATNADLQLKRLRGVTNIRTDLGQGKIYARLPGGQRNPSAQQFSDAVADAGFTLMKIEVIDGAQLPPMP